MARFHRLLPGIVALLGCVPVAALPASAGPASAAPTRAVATAPDAPTDLRASNGNSWVALAWTQPAAGPRPEHFRVYEGDTVVARNTTTRVTVDGLGFLTTHTFRVTAVAADGTESAASAPITRGVWVGGVNPACLPIPPVQLRIVDLSSSAVSLAWNRADPPRRYRVVGADQQFETDEPAIRLGGLAPAGTYDISVFADQCWGPVELGSVAVSTPAGAGQRPGRPTDVAATASTDSTVTVSWAAPIGGPPVRSYAVYRGATRLAGTGQRTVRLTGLWRGDEFPITVAAVGADGAESVHGGPLVVRTAGCDAVPPAPDELTAAAASASSVELHWQSRIEAASYTVLDGAQAVTTVRVPSARITGLPSGSGHRFRVVADVAGCGQTPASRRFAVTTLAGPGARPGAPTNLQPLALPPMAGGQFGAVAMQWRAPSGAGSVSYRIYEGATLIGATAATMFSTTVLPATDHQVTVVAVDAAGNESAPSNPITVTGHFLPVP
jgi:chitodextrinase